MTTTIRKTVTMGLALAALLAALAVGTALAETFRCNAPAPALCFFTNADDVILGNELDNRMMGIGGNDELRGGAGDDEMLGDSATRIFPGGNDQLFGGPGNDVLLSKEGADLLVGGPGSDTIDALDVEGEPGKDTVRAGGGNDLINAVDGQKDVIDCGKGKDSVTIDRGLDKVAANCEVKIAR